MAHFRALLALSLSLVVQPSIAFLPSQNPPWPATWNMSLSTMTMACNQSGWFNVTIGAAFGITSYDVSAGRDTRGRRRVPASHPFPSPPLLPFHSQWSNAKAQWAVARPMDCEERLAHQGSLTKAANPGTNVFLCA
jgi:hypothetical protein